jgi:glutathione reductase (NADPH)
VSVKVGDEVIEGKHILIATGGRPLVPDIPGAEYGITSDGFFELEHQPKKVAVAGAGYIAVELASVLNGLGSDTSLFTRHATFLRPFDPIIASTLADEMTAAGVSLHTDVGAITKVVKEADGTLTISTKTGLELGGFNALVWAIGRMPSTVELGLDTTGVKLDEFGYITVDEFQVRMATYYLSLRVTRFLTILCRRRALPTSSLLVTLLASSS